MDRRRLVAFELVAAPTKSGVNLKAGVVGVGLRGIVGAEVSWR